LAVLKNTIIIILFCCVKAFAQNDSVSSAFTNDRPITRSEYWQHNTADSLSFIVSGHVTNSETKEGIPFVKVLWEVYETETDLQGNYKLKIPKYLIRESKTEEILISYAYPCYCFSTKKIQIKKAKQILNVKGKICCVELRADPNVGETIELIRIKDPGIRRPDTFLDRLTYHDTLRIVREINGCEMHSSEKLYIYKRAETFFAILSISLEDGVTYPALTCSLTDLALDAYANFETEIKQYSSHNHGCTSTANYSISLKADKIEMEDQGCQFNRYDLLKEKLFGKTVIENYNKQIYH
jgi:hypothetical protein